jgi:hypothetical protein
MLTTLNIDLSNAQVLSLLEDTCGGFTEEEAQRAHAIIGAEPKYLINAIDPSDWSPKEKYELLNKLFSYKSCSDKGQIIANVSDCIYCH